MKYTGLLAAGMFAFFAASAQAATFGFNCITNNSVDDCGIAEAQVTMEVGASSGGVYFQFFNAALGSASFLSDIFWEDGNPNLLDELTNIIDGAGVDFVESTGNLNLPGGNTVAFIEALGAENAPGAANGVNPGENVRVEFSLLTGKTAQDVIDQLLSGNLRVGIHVQGFASGGSESIVNCTSGDENCGGGGGGGVVPIPATLPLLAGALLGGGAFLRRKRKA